MRLPHETKAQVAILVVAPMYLSGMGAKSISKATGICPSTVKAACMLAGVYNLGARGGGWNRGKRTYHPEQIILDEYREARARFPDWSNHPEIQRYKALRYYYANKDIRAEGSRANAKRNYIKRRDDPEFIRARYEATRRWKKSNRAKANRYVTEKRRIDPSFRIASAIRSRINEAISCNFSRKTDKSVSLVGCGWRELREHIERQFVGVMSWANYGKAWHIDHIVPCAAFDLSDPIEQKRCFHWSNMRPLWARANMRRGRRAGHVQHELMMEYA